MKARPVPGLDPDGPLAEQARRIVEVRLAEVEDLVPLALDPAEREALHDLRIAAKRLRYVLEVTAEPCFGPYAAEAAGHAKALQEVLGDVHDCDELLPRVRRLQRRMRRRDVAEVRRRAADTPDLAPDATRDLPGAAARRGLQTLRIHLEARRAHRFDDWVRLWRDLEAEGFPDRLRAGLTPPEASD